MNLSRSFSIKGFSGVKLRRTPGTVVKANVVKREGTRLGKQSPLPPPVPSDILSPGHLPLVV